MSKTLHQRRELLQPHNSLLDGVTPRVELTPQSTRWQPPRIARKYLTGNDQTFQNKIYIAASSQEVDQMI